MTERFCVRCDEILTADAEQCDFCDSDTIEYSSHLASEADRDRMSVLDGEVY